MRFDYAERSLGELIRENAGAWRVLAHHELDLCCSQDVRLSEACEAQQVDVAAVCAEIRVLADAVGNLEGWEDRPLPELVEHIQTRYHRPLEETLGHLQRLSALVLHHHGAEDTRLTHLTETITLLREELLLHLDKEEDVLFPWILSDGGRTAMQNIRVLILEHREAHDLVERLGLLSDGFSVPASVQCAAWQALIIGLGEFNTTLLEHVFLEDDVLFTRVLAATQ